VGERQRDSSSAHRRDFDLDHNPGDVAAALYEEEEAYEENYSDEQVARARKQLEAERRSLKLGSRPANMPQTNQPPASWRLFNNPAIGGGTGEGTDNLCVQPPRALRGQRSCGLCMHLYQG